LPRARPRQGHRASTPDRPDALRMPPARHQTDAKTQTSRAGRGSPVSTQRVGPPIDARGGDGRRGRAAHGTVRPRSRRGGRFDDGGRRPRPVHLPSCPADMRGAGPTLRQALWRTGSPQAPLTVVRHTLPLGYSRASVGDACKSWSNRDSVGGGLRFLRSRSFWKNSEIRCSDRRLAHRAAELVILQHDCSITPPNLLIAGPSCKHSRENMDEGSREG